MNRKVDKEAFAEAFTKLCDEFGVHMAIVLYRSGQHLCSFTQHSNAFDKRVSDEMCDRVMAAVHASRGEIYGTLPSPDESDD
jgi:hypothetical protein